MKRKSKILCATLVACACLVTAGIGLKSAAAEEKFELSVSMEETYARGSYFTVPSAELRVNGETCKASHTLMSPEGDVFTGKMAQLTELGEYKLTYTATLAGNVYNVFINCALM